MLMGERGVNVDVGSIKSLVCWQRLGLGLGVRRGAWASKDFRVFVIWPMGFWMCLKSRVPPTQPHGARAKKAKRREGKAKIQDPI